jgi:glutamate N-acetyltransferase/amino-acid N-acetyltransferase
MAERAAARVGCRADQMLVLSTGVIGKPLDMDRLERGIAALRPEAGKDAEVARAILTTDTRPKVASLDLRIEGAPVALRGFAKGAGMIHPRMATMLAVVTTDAAIDAPVLEMALHRAVSRSFNCVSVDGDTSTNDTALVLASGASGARVAGPAIDPFTAGLTELCVSLARQIARDGEGATRLVEIRVKRARLESEGHAVAEAIARSALVKTAVHGGDPNWGRILAAAGTAGVALEPERLRLAFGVPPGDVVLVEGGMAAGFDPARASALLRTDPVVITLDLGLGGAAVTHWTCDLSAEYVAINAHYTS